MRKNITGTTEVLTKVNNDMELTTESLDSVSGGFIDPFTAGAVILVGAALTAIGGKHTVKRIKNEGSCIFKGESAYPDNKFYTCR